VRERGRRPSLAAAPWDSYLWIRIAVLQDVLLVDAHKVANC